MNDLCCCMCLKLFNGIKNLKNHYQRDHLISLTHNPPKNGFRCLNDGCNKHFLVFRSLIRHIKQFHTSEEVEDEPLVFPNQDQIFNTDNQNLNFEENVENVYNQIEAENLENLIENVESEENLFNNKDTRLPSISAFACKMIASLRLDISFTGSNLDKVIDAATIFLQETLELIQSKTKTFLRKRGMNLEDDEVKLFLEVFNVGEPFANVRGLEGQVENLKNHFTYIDPTEIPLGTRLENRRNKKLGKYQPKRVHETMQYVSVIKTLKLINSHKEIRDYVKSEKDSPDGIISSSRDGESFKENVFFKKYPDAYRIQLYQDDAVVNNQQGSKVHAHKISAFYYKIMNLPLHLNSYLGGVHVLGLAHSADVTTYKLRRVMSPFFQDLKQLESETGVTYEENGEKFVIRASLDPVAADGLAIHQLFGLLSPSAKHFCRMCLITREELLNNVQGEFIPRSKQLYEEHVKQVSENPAASKHTGLREDSPLHASKYFHCTSNPSFDLLHDVLKGVGEMELKLVINHFVYSPEYDLTLNEFNQRINMFTYGKDEIKNKPSSNFSDSSLKNLTDHSLSQKAAQVWCLLRVFPFLVSDKVPKDDLYLELILLLNRINEILFAPKLRSSSLEELEELILMHNNLFFELFSHVVDPINKHHHLTHYPNCIKKSGPLRHLSCFLYEMKHIILKKRGASCCNYQNITKTLAKTVQMYQAATWGMNVSPREKFTCIHGEKISVAMAQCKQNLLDIGYHCDDTVLKVDKIQVYGKKYQKNVIVAVDSGIPHLDGYHVFGVIEEMISGKDGRLYLLCKELNGVHMEESLNSWKVEDGSGHRFIEVDNLPDPKPFNIWNDYRTDDSYICLRFRLV